MQRYEVVAADKSGRPEGRGRVDAIGAVRAGQTRLHRFTRRQAIDMIERGSAAFHLKVDGVAVDLLVHRDRHGHPYLAPAIDQEQGNGLSALPDCPT